MHFDVILHLLRFKLSPSPVHAVDLYCCFSIRFMWMSWITFCGCDRYGWTGFTILLRKRMDVISSFGVTIMDGQTLPFYGGK